MKKRASKTDTSPSVSTIFLTVLASLGFASLCFIAGPILLNANLLEPLSLLQIFALLVALYFVATSWVLLFRERSLNLPTKIALGFFTIFFFALILTFTIGLMGDERAQTCYEFLDFTRTPTSCIATYIEFLSLLYYWAAPIIAIVSIGLCVGALATSFGTDNSQTKRTHKRS